MSQTIITSGQSLADVAVQELGTVEALFELADAAGLAITDALTVGLAVEVPEAAAALPDVAAYFAGRSQRVNTGSEPLQPAAEVKEGTDFSYSDFFYSDFF
jgi:hypothetical protein